MKYNLRYKNILLISPERWGTSFVSKHHYALELAKRNNKVFFLNPPAPHNHLNSVNKQLEILNYKPKYRGLRRFPDFITAQLTYLELKSIEKFCQVEFDIIWNFDSSRFFSLSKITEKLKIAHLVDFTEDFERATLSKTSNICLASSEFIKDEMLTYNSNSFKIGHGVIASSTAISENDVNSIQEFKDDHKFLAGYVGNLTISYLDWQTLLQLIENHPEVGFVFVGPTAKSNISLGKSNEFLRKAMFLNNVWFTGEKKSSEIVSWLEFMDILLLIYKAEDHMKQLANPHKLLEYLKSGKIIVSSWTDEYKDHKKLIEMSKSNHELPKIFDNVIAHLQEFNSLEKQYARKNFAAKSEYPEKVNQIERLLQQLP